MFIVLRRKFFAFTSAVAACAAFFCLPAAAADFTCPYFSLPLTGDWAQQRMQPGSVPPNTFATLFASRKAGEGVLITVIPSDKAPKEAAQIMANNYKQQGMRVIGNPVQIPGQNAYRFAYDSANNKMHAIVFISGNGKHLANVSVLGRHGTGGLALLKGLSSKEDKLFPKF